MVICGGVDEQLVTLFCVRTTTAPVDGSMLTALVVVLAIKGKAGAVSMVTFCADRVLAHTKPTAAKQVVRISLLMAITRWGTHERIADWAWSRQTLDSSRGPSRVYLVGYP